MPDPISVIEGAVTDLPRDDIDTDQIIPARYMKRVERTGFGEFCFHEWRAQGLDLPPNPILVAGANFGCGSSREHAPWALADYGFEAIVAPSFADIFFSNCTKNGLLPVALSEQDCRALAEAGEGRIDLEAQTVSFGGRETPFEIDGAIRHRLLNGLDDIEITLQKGDAIDSFESAGAAAAGPVTTSI